MIHMAVNMMYVIVLMMQIGAVALLKITALHKKGEIIVNFCSTHYGHKQDLKTINLTKEERANIAGQLKIDISSERIIQNIWCSNDGSLERIHLIESQDIYNIKRQFGIEYSTK